VTPRAREARKLSRFRNDAARRTFITAYDAALACWPTPPTPRDIESRFGTTRVLTSGAHRGTPIVLLHGVAVSAASWFADVAALGAHHPVYAIDTITDAGLSTQTSRIRNGIEMAEWLDAVLAALDLDPAHLVGLSYGGWLVLNQARRAPTRLASVTAVDPPGAIGRPRLTFLIKLLPDSVLALAKSDAALYRLLRRLNNGTMPAPPLLDLSFSGLRTFVAKQPYPKRMTDDNLRAITTPSLLLFGERSPVNHVRRAAERAKRLLPNVAVDVIPTPVTCCRSSSPRSSPAACSSTSMPSTPAIAPALPSSRPVFNLTVDQ
jgi:pimeloyl-ACP methyl ester carboxylesterase